MAQNPRSEMRIQPKLQATVIDVAAWDVDAEFGVFPQGARAKDAVIAPSDHAEAALIPQRRYLFKRSKRSYPDQFWGEIVAYRVGCLMGLEVPPAFAAVNSITGHCGALIEWFYTDSIEKFVHGGDFLIGIQKDFDRSKGKQHNLRDIAALMRVLSLQRSLRTDWMRWWVRALLFDAMIGNSDRHQDNWGLIFEPGDPQVPPGASVCRLAPLFDNGTSLGHERFTDRVKRWSDGQLLHYVMRGTHHVKWALDDGAPALNGHLALLKQVLSVWSGVDVKSLRGCLDFDARDIDDCVSDLPLIQLPVPLQDERVRFVARLLHLRHTLLKDLLYDISKPPR